MSTENKTEGMLTTQDLAKMAGVDPRILRRILRKSFGGGSRKTYAWKKNDPQVQEIVKAAKATLEPKPKADKPAKAEKAKTPAKKVTKKATKKAAKPAEKPAEEPAAEETPVEEPAAEEQSLEEELTPETQG